MQHIQRLAACCLILSGAACSVGTFTGNVAGVTFKPQDAQFFAANYSADPNLDLPQIAISILAMTSSANACSDFTNHIARANEKGLVITLISTGTSALQPPAGTYSANANNFGPNFIASGTHQLAAANFAATDGNCNSTTDAESIDGSVVLTHSDASSESGTFTLTLGADTVSGSFSAGQCEAMQNALSEVAIGFGYADTIMPGSNPNSTCKP